MFSFLLFRVLAIILDDSVLWRLYHLRVFANQRHGNGGPFVRLTGVANDYQDVKLCRTVGYARRFYVTSKCPRHFLQSHLKCRNGEVLVSVARSETALMVHGRIGEIPKGTSLMVLKLTSQKLVFEATTFQTSACLCYR